MDSSSRSHGRQRFAFFLDALLLAVFVVLMSPRLTGLPVHEWIGIIVAVPVLVHVLLSWPWIATAARRLFAPSRARDTANTLLNLALFVTTTVVVVSGIVISQVALPWLGVGTIDDRDWRFMHNRFTNFMWWSAGAHIAMNWRWIVAASARHLPARATAALAAAQRTVEVAIRGLRQGAR